MKMFKWLNNPNWWHFARISMWHSAFVFVLIWCFICHQSLYLKVVYVILCIQPCGFRNYHIYRVRELKIETTLNIFAIDKNWNSTFPLHNSKCLAVQYQQSWAYAANANLLAANINWPSLNCTGSGIYAGRLGALEVFVSRTATTKVLIAKVPINSPAIEDATSQLVHTDKMISVQNILPTTDTCPMEIDAIPNEMDNHFSQDNMTTFAIEFLDVAKQFDHNGMVCKDGICCHYKIVINRCGVRAKKVRVFFTILLFHIKVEFFFVKFSLIFSGCSCTWNSHFIRMRLQCSMVFGIIKASINWAPVNMCAV